MTNNVTVIGLGAMGRKMADVYIERGYDVSVWNRTPEKAAGLNAKLLDSPAQAGDLVIISQVDYQAMYDSFDEADLTGKTLVNLSSDTPERLREAARWVADRGGRLVTGGIMVPPPGIGTPVSYVFYSGAPVEEHREALSVLGDVHHVGEDPGLAMLYYQSMLYIFWSTLTSFMHASALMGSAERLLPYAGAMVKGLAEEGPMAFLPILTKSIEAGIYPGEENNLHMQAVGLEHIVEASRDAGLDTTVPEALKDLFHQAVRMGHGGDGLASVIEAIRAG